MVAAYVSTSHQSYSGGSSTSAVLPSPTGATAGDLAIVILHLESGIKTITKPTGWTEEAQNNVGTTQSIYLLWKYLTGSEVAADRTFSWTGGCWRSADMILIRGGTTSGNPFGGTIGEASGSSGTTRSSISYTTSGAGLGFWIHAEFADSGSVTLPSGYTSRATSADHGFRFADRSDTSGSKTTGTGSGSNVTWLAMAQTILDTSATTHNITATGSGTTDGTAELRATRQITATGSGTSGGSAPLRVVTTLSASGSGQTDGTAALGIRTPISATGNGQTDGSAALGVVTPMSATGTGQTDGSADLDIIVVHLLTATGSGTTDGSAALTLDVLHIGATGTGATGGSAALGLVLPLSATGSGLPGGDAAITALIQLTASGSGQTDGSAAITIITAGTHQLTATGSGATDGSAALRVLHGLTATGSGQSDGSVPLRVTMAVPLTAGTGQTDGSAALSMILRMSASGSGQTDGSANPTIPTGYPIQATGLAVSGGSAQLTVIEAVWFFSPPTHEEVIQSEVGALNRYTLTHAKTIYRTQAGTFAAHRLPPARFITGVEGVDYFLGGRDYYLPAAVAAELAAAGYSPTLV